MGADGWITIYDAVGVDQHWKGPHPGNFYRRTIFGHEVYTVYNDTEGRDPFIGMEDQEDAFYEAVQPYRIDEWQVWT